MSKKMGRPKLPRSEALAEVFAVRLRISEARVVRKAISESEQKRSEWIRDALLDKVRKPKF
jgi:hypothetical protein